MSQKHIGENNIYYNKKLSNFSWFNLGGPAEILFRPDNINQLSIFLKDNNKEISLLGAGSNTLIRDGGVKGVTIKLSSKFSFIELENNNLINVGAATLDKQLSNFTVENSIEGFEFLSCIPGSIGGGIRMNCGCYGEEISKKLVSIVAIDFKGNIKEIPANQIDFFYRGNNLPQDLIILSAKFKSVIGNKEKIKTKQLDLINKKKLSQPSKIKTCGSTFKNTKLKKAWELIKESNCDKMYFGRAKISEKHCNFFVNEGLATSFEIEELIKKVKFQVLEKTGIDLDLEIKIIGNN